MTADRSSPVTCPVCRAANDAGPTCRRCRADLLLVIAVERQRDQALAAARNAARLGQWEQAIAQARHARKMRRGPDAEQLLAILHVKNGQFSAAWHHFQAQFQLSPAYPS